MRCRVLLNVAVVLMLSAIAGCAGSGKKEQAPKRMSINDLEQITYVYADRYMTLVSSACDQIARDNTDPQQRILAARVKLINCSSIYDIATSPDSFARLLDLMLVVTLQSEVWIDDGRANDLFGERAVHLESALCQARRDIWRIAEQALTPEQLDGFDRLILRWRRQNPNVQFVSYVRFNDVATGRARAIAASIRRGEGMLAPLDEAKQSVDAIRNVTERVFYFAKRLPFLIDWQGDVFVEQTLQKPEVQKVVKRVHEFPADVAAQREAFFASPALERRLKDMDTIVQQRIDQATKEGKGVIGFTTTQAIIVCVIFFAFLAVYSLMLNWVHRRWGSVKVQNGGGK